MTVVTSVRAGRVVMTGVMSVRRSVAMMTVTVVGDRGGQRDDRGGSRPSNGGGGREFRRDDRSGGGGYGRRDDRPSRVATTTVVGVPVQGGGSRMSLRASEWAAS